MKTINDLVRNEHQDFNAVKLLLDVLDARILNLEKVKHDREDKYKSSPLSLDLLWRIHNRLDKLKDVEAAMLNLELFSAYPDLKEYLEIKASLSDMYVCREHFLQSGLTFQNFGDGSCSAHQFFMNDGEIQCVFCGASTKGLNLSQEDKDVLIRFAAKQESFIPGATEKDLAFMEVLIEQLEEAKNSRIADANNMDPFDLAKVFYLLEEKEYAMMKNAIKVAHMHDQGVLVEDCFRAPSLEYLSDYRGKHLLYEIDRELKEIDKSTSRFKNLIRESLLTARFEVLILLGNSVPSLMANLSEDELIALVKAYYNLSNENYRMNSDYFANESDAFSYNCLTANPIINNKLLELKLRR